MSRPVIVRVKVDADGALRAMDGVVELVAAADMIAREHAHCRTDECCVMGSGNNLASALAKVVGGLKKRGRR